MTNPSPSVITSLAAVPNAVLNNPPDNNVSSVLSSVGVNTPSSSNGINSTKVPSAGAELKVNVVVEPSPLNVSAVLVFT